MLRRLGFSRPMAATSTMMALPQQQQRWTTIVSVRKGDTVVLMGDQQVTLGQSVVAKGSAKKLRRVNDNVMVGFAGSTADALTLVDKLEGKLNEFPNQLTRACVELAKEWRSDKALRRLEASLIVCDKEETLEIDGSGNVMTPEADGIVAIGSGGIYTKAAARALIDIDGLDAEAIARKAIKIGTDLDVFSNSNWTFDKIESTATPAEDSSSSSTSSSGSSSSSPSASDSSAASTQSSTATDDKKAARYSAKSGRKNAKSSSSKSLK